MILLLILIIISVYNQFFKLTSQPESIYNKVLPIPVPKYRI